MTIEIDKITFKALNWSPNEFIGESKMDAMTDNSEWLFKYTPRALYTLPGGITREEGIRIASGRVMITEKDSANATATVRFGNFFSARCQPLVTTGIVSEDKTRIFCVLNGIGQLHPDNTGFQVAVSLDASDDKKMKISKSFYVSWHAMGY